MSTITLKSLPDDELLRRVAELTRQSRRVESDLVAHVAEVDLRRLYLREACSSMHRYCTEVLHLSGAEAYLRITAARAAREHPVLLEMLADGRLSLSAISRLAPHLNTANRDAVLERAAHRTRLEVEEIVAELNPKPDVPPTIRKLPAASRQATPASSGGEPTDVARLEERELRPDRVSLAPTTVGGVADGIAAPLDRGASHDAIAPSRRATLQPLAPGRYRIQFTASATMKDKLERLRGLMRSQVPDGDLAALIEAAVTEKLQRLEARRFGGTRAPKTAPGRADSGPFSRRIPAAVRRAVWERDGGQCRYVDDRGRRCTARDWLQLHHRRPYGHGGAHSVDNLSLLCRAHNQYLAEVDYGVHRGAARLPSILALSSAST